MRQEAMLFVGDAADAIAGHGDYRRTDDPGGRWLDDPVATRRASAMWRMPMYPSRLGPRPLDRNGRVPVDIREDTEMKFGANEGTIDRVIRIVLGIALAAVAVGGGVVAPWLYVVWVVAAIALVTGVVGFCPLYALFRVSTKPTAR